MTNVTANFPTGDPIDPRGRLTPEWRAFFLSLFTRSGGTGGNDSAAIRADLNKAINNIADLQAESQKGLPAVDMGAVYSMIFAIEAVAAQAMSSSARTPDERGENGESVGVAQLIQRVAELEQQIEHYRADDALRQRIADLEARIDGAVPVIGDVSQLTGLGTMATQSANAVAITGGSADNIALGGTTPVQGIINTGLYTGQRFGNSGAVVLRSANGTQAAPTQITANTSISSLVSRGYDGTTYRDVASIGAWSDGSISSSSSSGYLSLYTTPSGSTSALERARVTSAGRVLMGPTLPIDNGVDALQVGGSIACASTTMFKSSVSLTNGAAAQSATLTNAPTAGNPTKWVPINDNGTTRYVPAW
ncbi:hypothetical protein KTE13_28855 [Burkholderia multivorans]|uniref:hypothetical protein n=1 Tax=Burkholderia multivorans TaxID=87883 RepID=UPI001C22D7BD|nr:hypothetical protein [Burkholderia multivorans]MBU9403760.1 hypothetical protein [Burkholderia multivorans]